MIRQPVALRKESVDRNYIIKITVTAPRRVALRKESVDRNRWGRWREQLPGSSLSARRAWIEISMSFNAVKSWVVALRKESVDRNYPPVEPVKICVKSLSVRRAWIEIIVSR